MEGRDVFCTLKDVHILLRKTRTHEIVKRRFGDKQKELSLRLWTVRLPFLDLPTWFLEESPDTMPTHEKVSRNTKKSVPELVVRNHKKRSAAEVLSHQKPATTASRRRNTHQSVSRDNRKTTWLEDEEKVEKEEMSGSVTSSRRVSLDKHNGRPLEDADALVAETKIKMEETDDEWESGASRAQGGGNLDVSSMAMLRTGDFLRIHDNVKEKTILEISQLQQEKMHLEKELEEILKRKGQCLHSQDTSNRDPIVYYAEGDLEKFSLEQLRDEKNRLISDVKSLKKRISEEKQVLASVVFALQTTAGVNVKEGGK